MSTVLRRVLFYFFILIFLALGAYLLVTAQGLVFDFENLEFVRTGALFLKFNPSDASLLLNGEPKEISRGLVIPGVLITDLLPGAYHLALQKEGHETWEKNLDVRSGVVTAATHIELWPATSTLKEVLDNPISDFWITDRGAVVLHNDATLHFNDITLRGKEVAVSEESSGLIVTKEGKSYYLIDLGNPENAVNISLLFTSLQTSTFGSQKTESIQTLFLHPFSESKLLITTAKNLFALDMKRPRLEKLLTSSSTVSTAISDNEALLLDSEGTLLIFNLLLQTTSEHPLYITQGVKMTASPSGDTVFILKNNGELFTYDRSSRATSTLAENVGSYFLSPGEERIAIITNDGSLTISALKDYHSDLEILKGTTWDIALPKGEIPKSFFWLSDFPNHGLIMTARGTPLLVELDERTPHNTHTLDGKIKKMVPIGTTLYLLKSDGIFVETTLGE